MQNEIRLPLSRSGYITHYLVSGPWETPCVTDISDPDQLRFEKRVREALPDARTLWPLGQAALGAEGLPGSPWRYWQSSGNWFIDFSFFYSVLTRVEFAATTQLVAPEDMEVRAALWTYGAVDVWVNGVHAGGTKNPVYKPILREVLTLKLHAGENTLNLRMQNLGVRDTRNIFGLQIMDRADELRVSLPDEASVLPLLATDQWLAGIRLSGRTLSFPGPAPEGCELVTDSRNPDLAAALTRYEGRGIAGLTGVDLQAGKPHLLVRVPCGSQVLTRRFEVTEDVRPEFTPPAENPQEAALRRIAAVAKMDRGGHVGFSMFNLLARRHCGTYVPERDDALLEETFGQIEARYDCSDFLMCGLLRYMKFYPLTPAQDARAREVILGYRYWMTQHGADAMCFWSENHALMFYGAAMVAGNMFPDAQFERAGMSGRELEAFGLRHVTQWLDDIEKDGFEEFQSGGYMCVTFAALLSIVDFAPEALSRRAAKLTDLMLEGLALHSFRGTVLAPQGRVYRDVLYPFTQGVQALMNLADPSAPQTLSEWLAVMGTSRYRWPDGLKTLMETPAETQYATGNALVRLVKTPDYLMTSVQSPRRDQNPVYWRNVRHDGGDPEDYACVKSLNECYHGTTRFEPGVFGYQQHMWYAALDPECVVFANHPGGTCDSSSMRPGYWYGNSVMPAVRQERNMLAAIYTIPEENPIHFTHVFWRKSQFTESCADGQWLFGARGDGYMALWCSSTLTPVDDMMSGAEFRAWDSQSAYLCCCGSRSEHGSLEAFARGCQALKPVFEGGSLSLCEAVFLTWETCHNSTQYI